MSSYLKLSDHQLYYGPEDGAIEWLWWKPYDPNFQRNGMPGFHLYFFRCKPCLVEWSVFAAEEEMPREDTCWNCSNLIPR